MYKRDTSHAKSQDRPPVSLDSFVFILNADFVIIIKRANNTKFDFFSRKMMAILDCEYPVYKCCKNKSTQNNDIVMIIIFLLIGNLVKVAILQKSTFSSNVLYKCRLWSRLLYLALIGTCIVAVLIGSHVHI